MVDCLSERQLYSVSISAYFFILSLESVPFFFCGEWQGGEPTLLYRTIGADT